ncbi:MAG: hypothetical protein A3F40_01670 [Chlamydiae bacterium RIFCSPHIGHO2_12_FULL_27_8]|nr:MAG: hypothetical protein A3F40_01670 [Chlamydiae bacterium RIFCSPHIGHO2_12_FULL_27_8]OGN66146.1 MAG: hypothetical protein A2888_02620 [Chlamydiae bacterium RIFCSPLOWO2_01_FULL_28_7]
MILRTTPWITEEAILIIESFLTHNENIIVLEFGSGGSTVWSAEKNVNIVSVEHDERWFDLIYYTLEKGGLLEKINYIFHPMPYYNVCSNFKDDSFDIIIVDGRNRKGCILSAMSKSKSGGLLILNNSERPYYKEILPLLSEWNLIITE